MGLVLTRRLDEAVIIDLPGYRAKVRVVRLRPDQVRLDFDFPKDIGVHREEVREAIDKEQHEPANAS